jgi:O-antigen/teichoic acid export membrane protein
VNASGIMARLRRQASRGVVHSGIGVLASSLARVLVTFVLARTLGPGDYGAVAIGGTYLGLIVLALDPGVSVALVQIVDLQRRHLRAAATISCFGGGLVAAGTLVFAFLFTGSGPLRLMLVVIAMVPLLRGASLVPQSLLFRERRMALVATAEVIGATVQLVGTIVAVRFLNGASAYAFPVLASEIVLAYCWLRYGGVVGPGLARSAVADLWKLTSHNTIANLATVLSRNVDNAIVGLAFGSTALSLYSVAYRFLWLPVQLLGQVVSRVALPEFAALKRDRRGIAPSLLRSTAQLSLLSNLFVTPLIFAGTFVVRVVFGAEWSGAGPIITVLSIAGLIQTSSQLLRASWMAHAKVAANSGFAVVSAVVAIGGYLIATRIGLIWVPIAYLFSLVVLTPAAVRHTARFSDFPAALMWKALLYGWPVFLGQAVVYAVAFLPPLGGQDGGLLTGLSALVVGLGLGSATTLVLLRRLKHAGFDEAGRPGPSAPQAMELKGINLT